MSAPKEPLKPFAPPAQKSIDEALKPEDAQARDDATKILRGKLPEPAGYTANHELVGPWPKGKRVSVKEVREHLANPANGHGVAGPAEQDAAIHRLVELNAFVPFYE